MGEDVASLGAYERNFPELPDVRSLVREIQRFIVVSKKKKMRVFRCKLSAALAIYILSSVCFPRFLEPGLCRSNTDTLLC